MFDSTLKNFTRGEVLTYKKLTTKSPIDESNMSLT